MCFQQNKRTNYYPTSELRWLMTRSTIEGSEKWFKRQLSYLIFPLSFSLSIAWCSLPYAVIIIVFVTSPSSKRVWMVDGTVCVQRRWQTMCAIEQLRESTIVTSMVTVGPKSGASTLCTFFSLYFILQGFFFSLRFLFRKFHSNLFLLLFHWRYSTWQRRRNDFSAIILPAEFGLLWRKKSWFVGPWSLTKIMREDGLQMISRQGSVWMFIGERIKREEDVSLDRPWSLVR